MPGENLLQDTAFDFDGAAPLVVAARAGLIDEVAALLAAGADVNESISLLVPLCAAAVPYESNPNLYATLLVSQTSGCLKTSA